MLITANGLITRVYETGNNDRILHIITEEHGRLSVMVKGRAGRRRDGSASATQLFTYGNFELYRGRAGDLYWLRNAAPIEYFYGVTRDVAAVSLAVYLCDVASELCVEEDVFPETADLLRMLLNTLYVLSKGDKPLALVKGVFEMRLAAMMGYQPDLTACARCQNVYPDNAYMDIMNGRIICADCQTELNRTLRRAEAEAELGERRIVCPVTASTLAALRYALAAPDRKIFSFSLADDEELRLFANIAETYLLNQLEQDFETLKFYRSVAD